MANNQILLSYPDSENEIRTVSEDSTLYFSLFDVVKTLASQNVELAKGTGRKPDGLGGLIKAQLEVLAKDEFRYISDAPYVSEPGLFRIILRDDSDACKKFQRWVLHEVLPSISKYGTYPPPLVEQNSDVKRIVQSLLLEIEEREALERRTKEQFKKHEIMLNDLSKKIANVSQPNISDDFISVHSYCQTNGVEPSQEQLILGWCFKITFEEQSLSSKKIVDGKEVPHFPEYVIANAFKNING
ncbi:BRO-N domain-containing protein [Psychromonas sp. PT13]|uniref:BRO-N domain-containing protein n=1 Tax=Psychromonas sp. PT13 TaxID=3439547 RepID=UPI003EBA856B